MPENIDQLCICRV